MVYHKDYYYNYQHFYFKDGHKFSVISGEDHIGHISGHNFCCLDLNNRNPEDLNIYHLILLDYYFCEYILDGEIHNHLISYFKGNGEVDSRENSFSFCFHFQCGILSSDEDRYAPFYHTDALGFYLSSSCFINTSTFIGPLIWYVCEVKGRFFEFDQ